MPVPPGILSVAEEIDRDGQVDGLARYGPFTRSFQVKTANRHVGPGIVLNALQDFGVWIGAQWHLNTGTPYEEQIDIFCTSIQCACSKEEGGDLWRLKATWEPVDPTLLTVDAIAAPEELAEAPIEVDWDEWTETRALDKDNEGYPLINTAGVRFADPVEVERHYPLLRIKRLERVFNNTIVQDYRDSVNASTWAVAGRTLAPRVAKCVSIRARRQWHQTIGLYYEVSYEFAIRPETWGAEDEFHGWDLQIANVGHTQRKAIGSSTLVSIIDPGTRDIVQWPVPLDADGLALGIPLAAADLMPTITYRVLKEKDFDDFLFPAA